MSFSLRNATPADIPVVTSIYRDSVVAGVASYETTPPDEIEMASRFSAIVANGYPYISAVDAMGLLIGYAYASAFRTRAAYRFMVEDSIYLAPEARGHGVGRALLAELIARCTALGFRQMVAVIGGAHPASIAVHRAAGFEQSGMIKGSGFKHGRWLDTVFMQLALGEGITTHPEADIYPDTLYSR
ncbi:GNAT family N-acetyltransferase [Pararhizobium gei]|uniref:GNAT family N-acetyltransferase n=1 Tax=Pararhizobium gei TaxID=1395951 RepID=UPI0023DAD823|nr:GNAT family N-acetyltransferase [Rhizobium gei]